MKAALAVWDGHMSPVLDVSQQALILTIENGVVTGRSLESIAAPTPASKLARLTELGVETLVCGAVSEPLRLELMSHGLKVIGFVAGEIEQVVASFLSGELPCPALTMPGYRGGEQRLRPAPPPTRGHGRGGHSKRA